MAQTKQERNAYMRAWNRQWRKKYPEQSRALSRNRMKIWRERNPEKAKQIKKKWRTLNIGQALLQEKNSKAKSLYGLPSYAAACEIRKCPCGICGLHQKRMHIDHSHDKPGTYRGVLCGSCNTRLGWFEKRKEEVLKYLNEALAQSRSV